MKTNPAQKVVCLSWIPILAETRKRILAGGGYTVVSLIGSDGVEKLEGIQDANLLVLAHSVLVEQKQRALTSFKRISQSPVLSLLLPYQHKLAGADYAVEALNPEELLNVISKDSWALKIPLCF